MKVKAPITRSLHDERMDSAVTLAFLKSRRGSKQIIIHLNNTI